MQFPIVINITNDRREMEGLLACLIAFIASAVEVQQTITFRCALQFIPTRRYFYQAKSTLYVNIPRLITRGYAIASYVQRSTYFRLMCA